MDAESSTSSAVLLPQPKSARRSKLRMRKRGDALPARMAYTALMACALMGFSSMAKRWKATDAAWDTVGQGSKLVDAVPNLGHGFGDLAQGRQLSHVVDPLTGVITVEGLGSLGVGPSGWTAVCVDDLATNDTSTNFPPMDMGSQGLKTFIQIMVLLWMFLGLAIVCDSFFEAALSRICEAMSLKDDVAGATWMAAGGSAPELATSLMGVFVSQSDVGFGTIVGSAVFNVLFVIAACAFVAPDLKLTWWPLARDASFYCFSMAILVFVISDLKVWFWEAIILLALYGLYVTIMYYNESLEVWVTERVRLCEQPGNGMQQNVLKLLNSSGFSIALYLIIFANAIMIVLEMVNDGDRESDLACLCGERVGADHLEPSGFWWINFAFNIFFIIEMLTKWYAHGFFGYWRQPLNCFDGSLVFLIIIDFILTAVADSEKTGIGAARTLRVLRFMRGARLIRLIRLWRVFSTKKVAPMGEAEEKPKKEEEKEEEEEEEDDDGPYDPFEVPESGIGKFFFVVGFPLSFGMYATIPDCRRDMFKSLWILTFAGCIFWIAFLSYFMVWMVTGLGEDAGIPDTVMGVTFLAAGTSIPDALSSIAVARRGHGDMAVSSSIGSNIFDILIGLPLPWLLYGAVVRPLDPSMGPEYVPILSDALAVMILSLFVMVALVVTTIHMSGWILSVKLGQVMMGLYCLFLVLCLLLEFDVMYGPCCTGDHCYKIPNL